MVLANTGIVISKVSSLVHRYNNMVNVRLYGIYNLRHGKTTLLNHIAGKQLAIPPHIDVLLCEQGLYMCVCFYRLIEEHG